MKPAFRHFRTITLATATVMAFALSDSRPAHAEMPGMDTMFENINAERGKALFAERGCVVCHAVNNVGGTSGPSLDATNMDRPRTAFDFFARMWRGADAMLNLQQADLGYQIDFSGQDLADIYAFTQDIEAQESFTQDDLPDHVREIIDNGPDIIFK